MSSFKLKYDDQQFKDRTKKVFDQLLVLENNRKNVSSTREDVDNTSRTERKPQKSETRQFRGKESIFKKPQNPAPKSYIHKIPDFKKNPHKWTKYSLEDVQDVTEESNTKSAMDFLRDLAKKKKLEQGIMEDEKLEELPTKIRFNRHIKATEESMTGTIAQDYPYKKLVLLCSRQKLFWYLASFSTQKIENLSSDKCASVENSEKPSFHHSKLVMPEYVIGQKLIRKGRKIKHSKTEKGKEVKLDHLMFEDE